MRKMTAGTILAASLLLPGLATAQDRGRDVQTVASSAPGAPVTCVSKDWPGEAKIVLQRLSVSSGTVTLTGHDSSGIAWDPGLAKNWVFRNGALDYSRANKRRFHLVVSGTELRGSYDNFDIPQLSRNPLIFRCNGLLDRVIVD